MFGGHEIHSIKIICFIIIFRRKTLMADIIVVMSQAVYGITKNIISTLKRKTFGCLTITPSSFRWSNLSATISFASQSSDCIFLSPCSDTKPRAWRANCIKTRILGDFAWRALHVRHSLSTQDLFEITLRQLFLKLLLFL